MQKALNVAPKISMSKQAVLEIAGKNKNNLGPNLGKFTHFSPQEPTFLSPTKANFAPNSSNKRPFSDLELTKTNNTQFDSDEDDDESEDSVEFEGRDDKDDDSMGEGDDDEDDGLNASF